MPPVRRSDTRQSPISSTASSGSDSLVLSHASAFGSNNISSTSSGSSTPLTLVTLSTQSTPNGSNHDNNRALFAARPLRCLGCKLLLPSYLFIALFPKSNRDYKEKCIKCRRSVDAVGDYVKTHGDDRGNLTLKQQFHHLNLQREVLKRWLASLAKMGVIVVDTLIDEAMEIILRHPALVGAKEWRESHPNVKSDQDDSEFVPTIAAKPLVLIHPNHLALLSHETSSPHQIVQARLPQNHLKSPNPLKGISLEPYSKRRSLRLSASTGTQAKAHNEMARHDSVMSNIERWTNNVEQKTIDLDDKEREYWMFGLDDAEVMAIEGLMRMRSDARSAGSRTKRFTRSKRLALWT